MKKKFALLLAGVMTLSVLVTGCGGGSSAKKEEAPAAEPAQEAAAEPAAEAAAEPASDYEYPDVTWKVAHACQEGSPSDLGCKAFADYITEKSGGKIKFELYPAGQLGTDIAELESRRDAIKAKIRVAKAQQDINKITSSVTDSASSIAAFQRMEDKADAMLDRAEAESQLNYSVAANEVDSLTAKYDAAPDAGVADELAALKAKLGVTSAE